MCTPSLAVDGGPFLACSAALVPTLNWPLPFPQQSIPAIIEFFDNDNTLSPSGIVIGTKITRSDLAPKLALVGGFVEVGETAEEALIREVRFGYLHNILTHHPPILLLGFTYLYTIPSILLTLQVWEETHLNVTELTLFPHVYTDPKRDSRRHIASYVERVNFLMCASNIPPA